MLIRRLAALALLSLSTLAHPQASNSNPQSDQERLRSFLAMVNKPVVLPAPSGGAVRVSKDIVYKRVASTELKMDAYRPSRKSAVPVVILIHGGVSDDMPLRPKDWGLYQSWGKLIAASGMGAITFNHRVGFPNPRLQEGSEDLDDLLRFVKAHANEWQMDSSRICLVAFSAGGPLLSRYIRHSSPEVRCLGAFYAFMDLSHSDLHRKFMDEQQIESFSNAAQLNSSSTIPLFIARAGKDQIPGVRDSIDLFIDKAVHSNADLTLINHPDGVHGFDNQNDDERSKDILRALIGFLRSKLLEYDTR